MIWNPGKPYLAQVEIHIMDSCNLNCKGCSHFSNLFPRNTVYSYDSFVEDLSLLAQKVFLSTLFLLGGEPLLNPHLSKYLYAARQIFPYAEIILVTNGLLIPKQSEATLKALRETKTFIEISLYAPTKKLLESIYQRMKGQDIHYEIRGERPTFTSFLGLTGTSDPYLSQQSCMSAFCRYVRNGKLYKCPVDALSYKYREHFGVSLPPSEGISIDSEDFDQKLSLLDNPVQLCRFCTEEARTFEWSPAPNPAKEDWFGSEAIV